MVNILEVKNLSKIYGFIRKKLILNNISLDIKSGKCVCIVGENGAGKSSLIKIIAKITPKNRGTVKINGNVGYVPESSINFQNMSAEENMSYYDLLSGNHNNYMRYLEEMSLVEIGKTLKKFSKGMKRKIDLIRAINVEPNLLLLDEPFEGLDPTSSNDIISMLKEEKESGTAILMSSHDMSYIERIADLVYILKNGCLIEIMDWKTSNVILIISGDFNNISLALSNYVYAIENENENFKVIVKGNEKISEIIKVLVQNDISIVRQEVVRLEDIYLQEVKRKNN
ncbi:MAG: ABC transporter ATP-binding protein [Thermoplasmataceae archaeon]